MGWALAYIEQLRAGKTVQVRPRGHSMKGKIDSGDLVTVEPIDPKDVSVGDIVLCKVKGREYLHLVKAKRGGQFLNGNNRGGENGWIGPSAIFGKCVKIEK